MEKAAWKLTLPLNREGTENAVFELKDFDDIGLFMATQSLIDQNKWPEAVMMVISALRVGGDEVGRIKENFFAFQTGMKHVGEMMKPVPGELKKISTKTESIQDTRTE
jgi:hypothetical protein